LTKKSAKKHNKKTPSDPSRFYKVDGQKIIPVGSKINNAAITLALNNFGIIATAQAVLIEPSERDYLAYRKMLTIKESEFRVFGSNCINTHDEQTITEFYGPYRRGRPANEAVRGWTEMGEINVLASTWDLDEHQRLYDRIPTIIHYMNNPKPWEDVCDRWPDLTLWWSAFIDACDKYRELNTEKLKFNHAQLECHIHECYVCKVRGENEAHKPGHADHCAVEWK
jgi:hypothetical protein